MFKIKEIIIFLKRCGNLIRRNVLDMVVCWLSQRRTANLLPRDTWSSYEFLSSSFSKAPYPKQSNKWPRNGCSWIFLITRPKTAVRITWPTCNDGGYSEENRAYGTRYELWTIGPCIAVSCLRRDLRPFNVKKF